MSCNTFDSIGSKLSPRILTPEQARARLMTLDQRIGYESNSLARHDIKTMTSTTGNLIAKLPKGVYPIIDTNVNMGLLTPSAIADFTEWGGYLDEDIYAISLLPYDSSQLVTVYQLLEYFLDENFAQSATGGTCASVVNALSQVIGFLSAGAKLISDLQNFSLSSVISQLTSWKNMLQSMVDELAKRMLEQLQNFANQIMGYAFQLREAVGRFMKKIEKAKNFFSDLTIQSIKDKIEEIIAKIAGQFEDLTPEALAHLLMVICQLADSITSFMQSPMNAISRAFNTYLAQEFALKAFTYDQVSKSVEAGNPRMDPRERDAVINTVVDNARQQGGASHLAHPNMTDEERLVINQILNTGTATSSGVTISHSAQTQQREKNGTGGWTYVITHGSPMLYVVLFRIAKAMNENLTVTCAYRNEQAQAEIRAGGGHPAKNSLHKSGMALDVSMAGFTTSQKAKFIDLASAEGIGGIQYYPANNFTHIDTGNVRWWPNDPGVGGESTIPAEIKEAEYRHLNGQRA